MRQRDEAPRALLRAHRAAHAHVPVGQHSVVRRAVVNLGHDVFELRVGWPVQDDPGAPFRVVVQDEDDGVPPPPFLGIGRQQQAAGLSLREDVRPVPGGDLRSLPACVGCGCGGEVRDDVVRLLLLLVDALAVRVLLVDQRRSVNLGKGVIDVNVCGLHWRLGSRRACRGRGARSGNSRRAMKTEEKVSGNLRFGAGAFRDATRVTDVPEGAPIPFDLDGIGVTLITHGAAFHRTHGALPAHHTSRSPPLRPEGLYRPLRDSLHFSFLVAAGVSRVACVRPVSVVATGFERV